MYTFLTTIYPLAHEKVQELIERSMHKQLLDFAHKFEDYGGFQNRLCRGLERSVNHSLSKIVLKSGSLKMYGSRVPSR